jgi:hypothetical protein
MKANILFIAVSVALTTTSPSFATASLLTTSSKSASASKTRLCHASLAFHSASASSSSPRLVRRTFTKKNQFRHFAINNRATTTGDDVNYDDDNSNMVEFFNTYTEWKPLFRNVMSTSQSSNFALASSLLLSNIDDDTLANSDSDIITDNNNGAINLWGITTLEQRHPWRLLPSKPTLDTSLHALSNFLDAWQQSLLDIPLDDLITGENDLRFLEEGRRTIAVTRFHVLDEYNNANNNNNYGGSKSNDQDLEEEARVEELGNYYDWETELFRTCWSEVAHLMHQDSSDTGSLVLLPDWIKYTAGLEGGDGSREGSSGGDDNDDSVVGLEYVQKFVENNIIQPIAWLGKAEDWEIVAMERGNLAVRLLYKLSDIPDLSKR